jgi:hypothetical protein
LNHVPRDENAAANRPPSVPLRLIVLPTEHGGWSFLGEPILLGLLVAPSWSGTLVALAAVAAFMARQPLRLFVSDRQRGKTYPRTLLAERAFAVLALVAAGALAGALALAHGPLHRAVLMAAPLGAAALAFDLGKRSREAAGELSGALALGAVAAAIALGGGWPLEPALALWGVLAARAVPTILFVRARLRLEKGQPAGIRDALWAHVVAIVWVALLAAWRLAPENAVWAMVMLAGRAVWGLSPARPRLKTWQLGVTEIVFGVIVVLAIAFGQPTAGR